MLGYGQGEGTLLTINTLAALSIDIFLVFLQKHKVKVSMKKFISENV